ncbi:hypothetical protein K3725_20140 (plasmid) [Leisingera sp. S132]|uniref:hypothetical protein n=1 Tax=Leisingera sp. S132 TaxID=2867016 RepID=UPI0021A96E83|nr:hypothetical protein [Leisingera sp. S132]UWQ81518.1 hypothetical protein K3725_20140 [Leisingera sp. S132]
MKLKFTSPALAAGILSLSFATGAAALETPQSTTVLEFADSNTLFVADSDGGRIFAYTLPEAAPAAESRSYNLIGLGARLAASTGADPYSISYHDIAVHPVSKETYISMSLRSGGSKSPMIVRVDQDGSITPLDLTALEGTSVELNGTPDDSVTFWHDIPAATFTVTDLDFVDGTLFAAGLSTGEFASTLRQIPYPFTDNASASSIEIYHTVHNQTETRAPIRAMSVVDLDGVKTVVAAYTCTPLVTIPSGDLADGAHVSGKTVAELGYGNTPLEVLHFTAPNEEFQPEEYVLVINKERDADLIRVADLAEASKGEGLSSPELWGDAGVKTAARPLGAVLQADDQDEQFLVTLKRNLDTGDVDLVSFRKGAYFRLSDFVSEYNFPDYQYVEEQEFFRNFQNMLKADAGYADLAR